MDMATATKLVHKTTTFMTRSTIKFWNITNRLAIEKEIDSKIEKKFKPKAITEATKAEVQVLDKIDLANPLKPLENYVNKRTKVQNTKLQQGIKNAKRLNCLGYTKNQELRLTKMV